MKIKEFLRWNSSFITYWLAILSIFIVAIVSLWHIMLYENTSTCKEYQEVTGRPTKLVNMNCYVMVDEEWYLLTQIRK
jgi:hypothetical protein